MLGGEGALTESSEGLLVNEGLELLSLEHFNLLDFVRSTETIEEIDKGNAALDGSKMGNTSEVHHFLNTTLSQHSEARLASGHHILMVAEDAEAVAGKRASTDMENAG